MKKKDLLILIIPFIILAIVYMFLPARIPRQFHTDGSVSYVAKEFIFILGILPYIVYKRYSTKK